MNDGVSRHYRGAGDLAERIAAQLRASGIAPDTLTASDFEPIDEFHFRGRAATVELLGGLDIDPDARVLDIGSGLGGVARTIAGETGAHVTGIDLTPELCEAAAAISKWVGFAETTTFRAGDASRLPFSDAQFDAATCVHVGMNIPDKAPVYDEAFRVLKPGARFGIYDILQGDGGEVAYPAPWAMEAASSHLATPGEMRDLLTAAGFRILREDDSTRASLEWLTERTRRRKPRGALPVTTQLLFGDTAGDMTRNQIAGLSERRMLTWSFICAR